MFHFLTLLLLVLPLVMSAPAQTILYDTASGWTTMIFYTPGGLYTGHHGGTSAGPQVMVMHGTPPTAPFRTLLASPVLLPTSPEVTLYGGRTFGKCFRLCTLVFSPVCDSTGAIHLNSCFFEKVRCYDSTVQSVNCISSIIQGLKPNWSAWLPDKENILATINNFLGLLNNLIDLKYGPTNAATRYHSNPADLAPLTEDVSQLPPEDMKTPSRELGLQHWKEENEEERDGIPDDTDFADFTRSPLNLPELILNHTNPVDVSTAPLYRHDCVTAEACNLHSVELLCGTDGATYLNQCHLLLAKCHHRPWLQIHSLGTCDAECCWLIGMVVVLGLSLAITATVAYKTHQRWKHAKQCLLLLRQMQSQSRRKGTHHDSIRPPSFVAPPIPPKPQTPPRHLKLLQKLSLRRSVVPPLPPRYPPISEKADEGDNFSLSLAGSG